MDQTNQRKDVREMTMEQWARQRCAAIGAEGAPSHMCRGYLDCALGREPNVGSVVGEPFAADDYHQGFALATYEIGPYDVVRRGYEEVAA